MRTILLSGPKRTLLLYLILSITAFPGFSQGITAGKLEYGFGAGPLVFLGDLGGNRGEGSRFLKDVNASSVRMSVNAFAQVHPAEWLGVRVSLSHGKMEGADQYIKDNGGAERHRKDRNLQFKSSVWEVFAGLEISPTALMEQYDGLQGKLRPYGFIGVGALRFNPKGEYFAPDGSSRWVALQPLRLEGQGMAEYPDRKEYKLTQLEIPVGGGFKYYLTETFSLGLELLYRKTFTDYLDDVSTDYIDPALFSKYLTTEQAAMANQLFNRQNFVPGSGTTRPNTVGDIRGNPAQNDAFFTTSLRMIWRMPDANSYGYRAKRAMGCPSFF